MRSFSLLVLIGAAIPVAAAQAQAATRDSVAPPSLPAATKLEAAFSPRAGVLATYGQEALGTITKFTGGSLNVDVVEYREATGSGVRGLVFNAGGARIDRYRSFVDEEEIDDLLKGVDVLAQTTANPTAFKEFEHRYRTKGDLVVMAYNRSLMDPQVRYSVTTGRIFRSSITEMTSKDLAALRALIVAGQQKLAGLPR